jgi:uncharacterized membrane protein
MPRIDATYRVYNDAERKAIGEEFELYPKTPKCAGWIAKYVTTNIADVIYMGKEYGEKLISAMREDGLKVTLETSVS